MLTLYLRLVYEMELWTVNIYSSLWWYQMLMSVLFLGKYAMQQLVSKLPAEGRAPDFPVSDNTIAAILATLYEVIKKNPDFAQ